MMIYCQCKHFLLFTFFFCTVRMGYNTEMSGVEIKYSGEGEHLRSPGNDIIQLPQNLDQPTLETFLHPCTTSITRHAQDSYSTSPTICPPVGRVHTLNPRPHERLCLLLPPPDTQAVHSAIKWLHSTWEKNRSCVQNPLYDLQQSVHRVPRQTLD